MKNWLGKPSLKKKKNPWNFSRFDLTPPPYREKKTMYFFSETRPLLGHFLKKSVFFPLEMSNTCKNFLNPKIAEKWLSIGTPPFFHPNFFLPKWLRMGGKRIAAGPCSGSSSYPGREAGMWGRVSSVSWEGSVAGCSQRAWWGRQCHGDQTQVDQGRKVGW